MNQFTQEEFVALNNALNEVLNGTAIEDSELHARLGIDRQEAEQLLAKLQELLQVSTSGQES